MTSFNDAIDSVIQDADEQFAKIENLSEIPFKDLLNAFVASVNKQKEVGLDWNAVCRTPSKELYIDESWPEQLRDFYSLCDGVEIDKEGDSSISKTIDLVLGENLKPKLSKSVKKNLEKSHRKKRDSLPVFENGGTQALLNLMNDECDHEIPLRELDKQLILQSDEGYNFLVYFIDDVEDIQRGSLVDIEGGVGTRFKSLRIYLAFQSLLFDDW